MITLLNTSILTAHGVYRYTPLSLTDAREMLLSALPANAIPDIKEKINKGEVIAGASCDDNNDCFWMSAIGHESTAQIMTELLRFKVKVNRIQYRQLKDEKAIVFKLKTRAPEGKILSKEQIEEIGYEWGLLERIE